MRSGRRGLETAIRTRKPWKMRWGIWKPLYTKEAHEDWEGRSRNCHIHSRHRINGKGDLETTCGILEPSHHERDLQ